ncbi:unnamed protein product [Orchesella dallaii]|uniref:ODAD1 central coiled coil region domain-containing protein n=1 Tax=Orchesella dallaii TaxID=48710 RepID=A0ABP1R933_9HEXA
MPCEVLRDAVHILRSKIESAHAEVDKRERNQRKIQEKLQLSIMAKQELQSHLETQKSHNNENIKQICNWIAGSFALAQCDASPIMKLLGNIQGVTKNNIRLCMQQMDFKITEMKTDRDRLQSLKSSKSIQNFKTGVLKPGKMQSCGGPFFPKVIIGGLFNVDTLDEDDAKIMEQEPFYYKDMREYMYLKMIEERIIDPGLRTVTTIRMPSGEPTDGDGTRLTLVERIAIFHKTHSGRKSKKTSTVLRDDENVERDNYDGASNHLSRDETQMKMYQKNIHSHGGAFPSPDVGDPLLGYRKQNQQRESTGSNYEEEMELDFDEMGGSEEDEEETDVLMDGDYGEYPVQSDEGGATAVRFKDDE